MDQRPFISVFDETGLENFLEDCFLLFGQVGFPFVVLTIHIVLLQLEFKLFCPSQFTIFGKVLQLGNPTDPQVSRYVASAAYSR